MVIEAGHEGAVLAAAEGVIQSYRQLPILLYETWQQLRGEERLVGGLFGAREGRVVDAYSLHADAVSLGEGYQRIRQALTAACMALGVDAYDAIAAEDAAGMPYGAQADLPCRGRRGDRGALSRLPLCC